MPPKKNPINALSKKSQDSPKVNKKEPKKVAKIEKSIETKKVIGSKRKLVDTKASSKSKASKKNKRDLVDDDDDNDDATDENVSDDNNEQDMNGDDCESEKNESEVDNDDDEMENEDENSEDDHQPSKKKKKTQSPKKASKVTSKLSLKEKGKSTSKQVTKKSSKVEAVSKDKSSIKVSKKANTENKSTTIPASEPKQIKPKILSKLERLEEARKAYKWWEAPELPDGINWHRLEHTGIKFAPPYVRHNYPLFYDGKEIELNNEQEEIATFYAAIPEDGPQLGNPKTRNIFQSNFLEDFNTSLGSSGQTIKDIEKCDFSKIKEHIEYKKSLKKAASDEEKASLKLDKDKTQLSFGYALVDGRMEKMGNFNMEPPGLFRGRGEHPKTGHLKERCFAESVFLNLSHDVCVPKVEMPGHAWKEIRHDSAVTWLCNWQENVNEMTKYVQLSASSSFKGKSDLDKYDTAIRLKGCIGKVRRDYTQKIKSKDISDRQLGTAMWVIDMLALRVGGEKGDDEADTVGCCSLRKEHLRFNENPDTYEIELEFLGKDSMLFKQNIEFSKHGDIGKQVYHCLKSFCAGKEDEEDIFETLTPTILNKHLNSIMKGLTAKVFRTYNASVTLEEQLPTPEAMKDMSIGDKVMLYNAANRQVAILCNHQRTVSKATETMFENLNEKLATLKDQKQQLIKWKDLLKKKKEKQIPLKDDDKELIEGLQLAMQNALLKKADAKTDVEKIEATAEVEAAKVIAKQDQQRRFQQKHMFKSVPTESAIDVKIAKWIEEIQKLDMNFRNRDENKEVALGTSKINYMDPRISVAWCKRCEVPIDKVFAKTLRDKFNWAMAVPPDWKFE